MKRPNFASRNQARRASFAARDSGSVWGATGAGATARAAKRAASAARGEGIGSLLLPLCRDLVGLDGGGLAGERLAGVVQDVGDVGVAQRLEARHLVRVLHAVGGQRLRR